MRSDCGFAVAKIGSGERTREPIARWGGTLAIAESPLRSLGPRQRDNKSSRASPAGRHSNLGAGVASDATAGGNRFPAGRRLSVPSGVRSGPPSTPARLSGIDAFRSYVGTRSGCAFARGQVRVFAHRLIRSGTPDGLHRAGARGVARESMEAMFRRWRSVSDPIGFFSDTETSARNAALRAWPQPG